MKVEFFRLLEDHTWDTFICDVPDPEKFFPGEGFESWQEVSDGGFEHSMQMFVNEELVTQAQHRKTVAMGVYSWPAEESTDESTPQS